MTNLEVAIKIALDAHSGQVDKAGNIYILHPIRVMMLQDDETKRIVGILHDVVEDCKHRGWNVERIQQLFGREVGEAIDAISQRDGEDYDAYIRRVASNPIAAKVKLDDLQDNITRLYQIKDQADAQRKFKKYADAQAKLRQAIDGGNFGVGGV